MNRQNIIIQIPLFIYIVQHYLQAQLNTFKLLWVQFLIYIQLFILLLKNQFNLQYRYINHKTKIQNILFLQFIKDYNKFKILKLKNLKAFLILTQFQYNNNYDRMNTTISDDQLRTYIDQIFMKYDRDRSGNLNSNQLTYFFNDIFNLMGSQRRIYPYEAEQAIKQIDKNNDGQANKQQLFLAFKQILSAQQPQQPTYNSQNTGWGQQGGYNQQQSGWGQQPTNQGWGNQPSSNQGWGNQPSSNQGWGNQPQNAYNQPNNNQGWGQNPSQNQGWNTNPQQNYSSWGNQPQQQPNYQKNWGSSSGW